MTIPPIAPEPRSLSASAGSLGRARAGRSAPQTPEHWTHSSTLFLLSRTGVTQWRKAVCHFLLWTHLPNIGSNVVNIDQTEVFPSSTSSSFLLPPLHSHLANNHSSCSSELTVPILLVLWIITNITTFSVWHQFRFPLSCLFVQATHLNASENSQNTNYLANILCSQKFTMKLAQCKHWQLPSDK